MLHYLLLLTEIVVLQLCYLQLFKYSCNICFPCIQIDQLRQVDNKIDLLMSAIAQLRIQIQSRKWIL